jgi:hypothetical protein
MRPNTSASFWKKVDSSNPDGCWPWLGAAGSNGYGKARMINFNTRLAHVIAFTLAKSEPTGMVLHSCHNKICCNPAHLSTGNHSLNARQSIKQGNWTSEFQSGIPGVFRYRAGWRAMGTLNRKLHYLYQGPSLFAAWLARTQWEIENGF